MAILRAEHLARLSRERQQSGRTLIVTFNKALVAYLQSVTDPSVGAIDVRTFGHFGRGYLAHRKKMGWNVIAGPDEREAFIEVALKEAMGKSWAGWVTKKSPAFLNEEFRWIAQHGVRNKDDYIAIQRVGKAGTRIEKKHRPAVFAIYCRYLALRTAANKQYDWDDLGYWTHQELLGDNTNRLYRHIVIDEGQDFSPVMLRALAAAVPGDGSLTFFGDMAQQIYGHRMSWRSAGLTVREVVEFKENYRNSLPIARLALAVAGMPYFTGYPDLIEPNTPSAIGPEPALICFDTQAAEADFVATTARGLADVQSVAVLVRTRELEKAFKRRLGSDAVRLDKDIGVWPDGPGVFYGCYHSAKGLEFDTVFLPRLDSKSVPHPADVETFGSADALSRDGRLLYVAITRAKSGLVLSYSGKRSPLLPREGSLYNRVKR